jgi:hypothetical protein
VSEQVEKLRESHGNLPGFDILGVDYTDARLDGLLVSYDGEHPFTIQWERRLNDRNSNILDSNLMNGGLSSAARKRRAGSSSSKFSGNRWPRAYSARSDFLTTLKSRGGRLGTIPERYSLDKTIEAERSSLSSCQ